MYQRCPICNGTGVDQTCQISNGIPVCPTCKGRRIIHTQTAAPPEINIKTPSNCDMACVSPHAPYPACIPGMGCVLKESQPGSMSTISISDSVKTSGA